MKLEITETGNKEYYDEFLYIANIYQKFKKNPRRKAHEFTKVLLLWTIITIVYTLLLTCAYLKTNDAFYIFLIGMTCFAIFFEIMYLIILNKKIKIFMNNKGKKIVELGKEGVNYTDADKSFNVKWEDISYIIINKQTICVIPKTVLSALISINIKYKKEISEALKKYDKEALLIDNSNFYK